MRKILIVALASTLFVACKKSEKKADPAPAAAPAPAAPTSAPTPTEAAKPAEGAPAQAEAPAAAVARPASITDADVVVADKLVSTLKEFGDALTTAGTDCKAATAAAKAFGAKFKPISEEAEKIKARTESDADAKKWFEATYMPKMQESMAPMMKTAQACASDKDFMAAMTAIQMPGRKVKSAP